MINIKRALIIIPVTSCLLYANAENEDLKYLLKDSNTKFPVSDYIWQEQRPKQNVSDFYNSQSNTNNPAKPNSNLATKGNQVKLVGYDENGNPIYMDENGNLVDKNGNLILDSNGNPIKVKIGKDGKPILVDSNGNLVDSSGKPILDSSGKPIKVLLDENGNPILVDSNGNLVDSKGKPILDKNGKPIKVLIDPNGNPILMDSEGNLVDSSGKPILDKYGKPIKVAVDKNGNVVLVDSKGNLVDKDGDLILDTFGKPIRVEFDSDGNAILYDSNGVIIDSNKLKMLMKKHQVEKDLKKKKLQRKSKGTQGSKGKYTQKGKGKGNVKAKQPRHPILDEYGVDDLSELDNSEMSLDEIMRQSLLVANDSKTKEASTVKYGDSSFSNQENIDEATNEHKLHRMIPAGKLIPCVLLTPINSEIEGIVSAQVEQDIYAHMGKAVLIPRGSKVIGFYKNDNNVGQARLQIVWREIITPQGVNVILTNAVTGDSEGYAGAKGYLNNRYWQRYGVGISMQTLANSLTFAIANGTQKPNASAGSAFYTGQVLAQGQADINTALKQILQTQQQIKPIIQIKAGSRIFITPSTHIWFPIPKKNEIMAKYFEEQ